MPEMTGVDLARRLIEVRPDIPVILCTGFSETVDSERARSLGIREMLMKPILANHMAMAIRRALDSDDGDEPAEREGKRILIVEDDEQVREMIRQVLEMEGYHVLEASDGRHGIRLCREDPADLLITDIFMPEKDGLQVIREIRLDRPNAKIIAISGGGETVAGDFLRHASIFGADRVFSKPLSLSELVLAVRELLEDPPVEVPSPA
jgi:CheY-like chemotaxis protein